MSSATPITLNAPLIIIEDDAVMGPNITLNGGWLSDYPSVPPVPAAQVTAFCNSPLYKDARIYARPVAEEPTQPEKALAPTALMAVPNPFTFRTQIRYELPAAGPVRLWVSDLMGRPVAQLVNEPQSEGWHEATFVPQRLTRGIYLVTLQTDGGLRTERIVLQ